jgi:hypothetical protein
MIDTEYPGFLESQDIFYVRPFKCAGSIYQSQLTLKGGIR